jgi:TRAP-type C4-dicarboxylate transport system permease small subunit
VLRRINDVATNALMVFAGFWAFFLGFYICADVIARNLNIPVQGTNEIVRDSIVMMVFLQLAYCVKIGGMLRADFLAALLPVRVSRVLNVFGALAAIAFFLAVLYGAWGPAVDAIRTGEFQGDGALRVPAWPARVAILIGCALAALNYALIIADEFAGKEHPHEVPLH